MIVSCPKCSKKYRIPDEKIGNKAKRIRCRKCGETILINPAVPAVQKKSVEPNDTITRDDTYTRARRLARVLASDMLIYNRELVDQARKSGDLQEVMAAEIKRSWDLWNSRFPKEIVEGTDLFREALNEILAGGEDIFSSWNP